MEGVEKRPGKGNLEAVFAGKRRFGTFSEN